MAWLMGDGPEPPADEEVAIVDYEQAQMLLRWLDRAKPSIAKEH